MGNYSNVRMYEPQPVNNRRSYLQNTSYRGNTPPFNGFQNSSNRKLVKKSGAKFKQMEDGAMIVSGWFVRRGVLFKVYCRPYKNTKSSESKTGKTWVNLFCTITNTSNFQSTDCSALLDVGSKRCMIKAYNLILTTRGKGGYCGTQFSNR